MPTTIDIPALSPLRYSAAQFLIALVLLICVSPVLDDFEAGEMVESILLTLVLISAVPAVGGSRRSLLIAGLLALPAVAGKWVHFFAPGLVPMAVILAATILFAAFIVVHHFLFILNTREVDSQVLCASISTFLMLGILWTFGYLFVDHVVPESFNVQIGQSTIHPLTGFEALYFSLGNLSGLSFGDITPNSNIVRMLASVESMASIFYLAILISRLVALHTERAGQK